jgi:hypothetical protein
MDSLRTQIWDTTNSFANSAKLSLKTLGATEHKVSVMSTSKLYATTPSHD